MQLNLEKYRRGTHSVDREVLHAIPLPPAGERTRWRGIRFGQLADTLIDRVQNSDLLVTGEKWSVDRGGERMFGFLDLDTSLIQLDFDKALLFDQTGTLDRWRTGYAGFKSQVVSLRLAVVHSNDSSLSLRLCVFPSVKVCENGMCVEGGWIACQRKHTKGLDLVEALDGGIQTFLERTGRIGSTIQSLEEIDLSNSKHADHILMEAGRMGIVPWSSIGKVEKEWREPRHPEFHGRTGWSMVNAFTEVAKSFSMHREMVIADRARQLVLTEGVRN